MRKRRNSEPCERSSRAKASWVINHRYEQLPPQFAVVERMIEDQQRYLDNSVSLAVHCMGPLAELPFEMLAVLVLSDKHLSRETITTLDLRLDPDNPKCRVMRRTGSRKCQRTCSTSLNTPRTGAAPGFSSALSAG